MQIDDLDAAADRINAGAEVATLEPSFIEYMWRRLSSIPKEQRQSTPAGISGICGVIADPDPVPQNPDQRVAMMIRYALLNALVERGILDDYMKDESLRQKVFAAAALFPCDKNDLEEAVAQGLFRDSSADVVQKSGEELRQAGYASEHPKVGGKFIEWMRHNC
jgi:hypothetical protein